ncbi:MAG: ATP-binding protein [Bacteroidota bacterium]
MLVGRTTEKTILSEALESDEAELIAVTGRRRVGKTFLIRSVYEGRLIFELTGVYDASLEIQLKNFSAELKGVSKNKFSLPIPKNWFEAYEQLKLYLEKLLRNKKTVVFLDEFPWLHTPKSGFLSAFEHFWNSWASRKKNLAVVICGSSASWMLQNVVNSRGGLHNRISRKIRLLPFTLRETEEYLKSRRINLDRYQLLQLYMAMGGVPYYLKAVKPGLSAAQNIDRLCFAKDGTLRDEFVNLYRSLFAHAEIQINIIRTLAGKKDGLDRNELLKKNGFSSGGAFTKIITELEESGFISRHIPFGKKIKDSVFKLTDEFSMFYLKFMEGNRQTGDGTWLRLSGSASWKSWSGFAFEGICFKHIQQIKEALGISGVQTMESVWRHAGNKKEPGAQIDLLIDRGDYCINVCEMKFTDAKFTISKSYAENLRRKISVFTIRSKTTKTLFLTMITAFGVKQNEHSIGLVQNEILMGSLFE